jgi:hypothetical protein
LSKKITTKSGANYYITDDGLWWKNDGHYQRRLFAYGVTPEDLRTSKSVDELEAAEIEVGNHLHIGGFDSWWLSTPIVSIEEY